MGLGPLVGTYDSALSSIVKMKRADVNSKNSPLLEGKKGPLPPASVLCWTPAVRKQYPLPAPTNSFLKHFFSSSPFPPPAIMSFPFLTHSHPSFLPPYKPWVMNEVLKSEPECMTPPVCLFVIIHPAARGQRFAYILQLLLSVIIWKCQTLFLVLSICHMFAMGGRQTVCA